MRSRAATSLTVIRFSSMAREGYGRRPFALKRPLSGFFPGRRGRSATPWNFSGYAPHPPRDGVPPGPAVAARGWVLYLCVSSMASSSLAPGLLVAAPRLGDRNFDRSVVLLAAHGPDGAFGWVINGREVMTVDELLTRAEVPGTGASPRGGVR